VAASRRNHGVPVRAAPTLALPRSYAERASENPPARSSENSTSTHSGEYLTGLLSFS
jgi:hypothetical protein